MVVVETLTDPPQPFNHPVRRSPGRVPPAPGRRRTARRSRRPRRAARAPRARPHPSPRSSSKVAEPHLPRRGLRARREPPTSCSTAWPWCSVSDRGLGPQRVGQRRDRAPRATPARSGRPRSGHGASMPTISGQARRWLQLVAEHPTGAVDEGRRPVRPLRERPVRRRAAHPRDRRTLDDGDRQVVRKLAIDRSPWRDPRERLDPAGDRTGVDEQERRAVAARPRRPAPRPGSRARCRWTVIVSTASSGDCDHEPGDADGRGHRDRGEQDAQPASPLGPGDRHPALADPRIDRTRPVPVPVPVRARPRAAARVRELARGVLRIRRSTSALDPTPAARAASAGGERSFDRARLRSPEPAHARARFGARPPGSTSSAISGVSTFGAGPGSPTDLLHVHRDLRIGRGRARPAAMRGRGRGDVRRRGASGSAASRGSSLTTAPPRLRAEADEVQLGLELAPRCPRRPGAAPRAPARGRPPPWPPARPG